MNPRISFVNTRLNDIKTSMRLTEEYGMLAVLPSSGTSDVLSTLSLMDEQNSCVLFKQQEKSLLLPMLMDTSLLQHEPHWSSFIV